jgi:autotransporter-associated beta strand protein
LLANTTVNGALNVKANTTLAMATFALATPTSVALECGAVAGSIISGSGTLTLGGSVTVTDITTGTIGATISCPVALGGNRIFNVGDDGSAATDLTISGVISGGSTLTKNGVGTLILSGSNTYTGTTTVSTGTLKLGATGGGTNTPLGTIGSGTVVASGAVLDLNSFTLGTPEGLTLNGTGLASSSAGALTNTGGNASYSGAITLGSACTITTTSSGTLTCSGTVVGAFGLRLDGAIGSSGIMSGVISAPTSLNKDGLGTWTLAGSNTYTGVTSVNSGTLKLGNTAGLGTTAGATTIISGAVLDLNGINLGAESLTLNGTGLASSPAGALTNTGGNASYSGAITLGSASTITATSSGTLTCSGTVGTGAFGLTLDGATGSSGTMSGIISAPSFLNKEGLGTWTLSGSNTYTGTTSVNAGTLRLGVAEVFYGNLAIASGASVVTNNNALTFQEDFINNGTFTGGSSAIIISGSALQSIGSFSTSGGITMSKTTGAIATLTGSVNAGSLTINGSGGRLSLGTGLTHTITGDWVRTQGTLNGGSSTLKIGGNISGTGSTFTAETSTVEFYNGNQNLGTAAITYNNLTLSGGTGAIKILGAVTTVSDTWAIIGVKANLGTFTTHGAKILTLNGSVPSLPGSSGSTSSAATNKDNNYFTATTGMINFISPIDNNYAAYNNSTSNLFASVGENTGPLTLTAPDGYVFINTKFASYGTPGGIAPNYTIGGCHAPNSRSITTGLLGNTTAMIPASGVAFNTAFGDPCSGTIKTYSIVATYALPICSGSSPGIITGSTPTGGNGTSYTYLWEQSTSVNGTYTTVSGTSNAKDYTPGTLTTTTYYRRTVTSGIYSDATIVIVPVISAPSTAPTITSSCSGSTLTASASTIAGTYVEWFSGTCGSTVVGTGLTYNPTVTGNHFARYRNTCGIGSCSTASNVTSTASPVSITPASSTSICSGTSGNSTVNLSYTIGGSVTPTTYTITWSPNGYLIDVFDRPLSSSPIILDIPDNAPAGTYTGSIKVKTSAGCVSAAKTFTLTIGKVAGVASSTPTLCINTALTAITHTTINATGIGTAIGLPAGVTASWAANTITISGTPTESGTFAYTIPLTGSCIGSADATGTITVNIAPAGLTYDAASPVYCAGIAVTNNATLATTGIPAVTYSVSPALPTGLSINSTTGAITGTPTVATAATNYTVTATNSCGNTTSVINITVNIAPAGLTYGAASPAYCVGTAVTNNATLATTGVPAVTYSVSPALPTGLSINSTTGAITGTPTVATAAANYTVTATNSCGSTTDVINITVNIAPAGLTYDAASPVYCAGTAVTNNVTLATTGVPAVTYSVSPALPTGLSINSTTGAITGTPTVATAAANYTVTATNSCGNTTSVINMMVNIAPAGLTYGAASPAYCVGTAVTNSATLATTGVPAVTYSVSPALPTGLSINSSTGAITGTPTVATAAANYTVTATNSCGNTTSVINITVNIAPAGLTYGAASPAYCVGTAVTNNATLGTTGVPAVTYSVSPALPTGLSINSTTGAITGTPTVATGAANYTVTANNSCGNTTSIVNIIVNALPTTPTASVTVQPTCSVNTGTIVVTAPTGAGIAYSIDGTNYYASGTFNNVAVGSHTVSVKNSSDCVTTMALPLSVSPPVTKTWLGGQGTGAQLTNWSYGPNWSPAGVPTSADCVIIPTTSNNPIVSGTNLEFYANTLSVIANGSLVVQSGNTLKVTDAITVAPTGTLTFQDSSTLLQESTDNTINSGSIEYVRTTLPIRQADYVYWSTPVKGQTLAAVSPLTESDKYFRFDGTGWVATPKTTVMTVGKGYIIRGPEGTSNTVRAPYTATFKGIPNNGTVTSETYSSGKYYLIGNPYPSAIDADKFLSDLNNKGILQGTLYFWTHNTPVTLGGYYRYNADDYASYNLSGGTKTMKAAKTANDAPGNIDAAPQGYIAAGQSFMAGFSLPGQIQFTNSMRIGADKNGQFFKPGKTSKTTGIEKNRVWLNLTNEEGAFKQMLVGYIEGATNDYDRGYDGTSFDGNKYIDFYSIGGTRKFVIQGRGLPFTDTDIVPLGYKTTIAGDFTISIDQADGIFTTQSIYLEDKTTGKIQDLRAANYTFTTAIGTFTDRFVLRYTNKTLGTGDFENIENGLLVSVKDKTIKVTSAKENIKEVTIFDINGKLLYNKKKVGSTELQISNLQAANQVLLVKVTLENEFTATKKIIFQ